MPKHKKTKNKGGTAKEEDLTVIHSNDNTLTESSGDLPILRKLESGDVEDREGACAAIANMVLEDPNALAELRKGPLCNLLIYRLTDPFFHIRQTATGALSNVCLVGGEPVCAELMKLDVLIPLLANIQKAGEEVLKGRSEGQHAPASNPPVAVTLVNGNKNTSADGEADEDAIELPDEPNTPFSNSNKPTQPQYDDFLQLLTQSCLLLLNLGYFSLWKNQLIHVFPHVFPHEWISPFSESSEKALEDAKRVGIVPGVCVYLRKTLITLHNSRATRATSGVATTEEQRVDELADESCAEAALRLLLLLSEDDRTVVGTMLANGAGEALARAITSAHLNLVLRATSASIAVNMREVLGDTEAGPLVTLDEPLVTFLLDVLRLNTHSAAASLLPQLVSEAAKNTNTQTEAAAALKAMFQPGDSLATQQQAALTTLQQQIAAQQLVLETLTNLYTRSDVEDLPEDNDNELVEDAAPQGDGTDRPATPTHALQARVWSSTEFLPLLLDRCAPVPVVATAAGTSALALMESLVHAQEASLICTNNLLLLQTPLPAGSHAQIWKHLCAIVGEEVRRQSQAVSLALALTATFVRNPRSEPLGVEPSQIEGILLLATQAADEEVRSSCIEVLGGLRDEPLMAANPNIVVTVAAMLASRLADSSPRVVAQALNTVFDLFADHHLAAYASSPLPTALATLLPQMQATLKQLRKSIDRNVWHRLDEARINLRRFLEYKAKQK